MGKLAVLYTFPEPAFNMAIQRLQRLRDMNPMINFFPSVGPRQLFYIPMIIDKYMFGSDAKRVPLGDTSHTINWLFLSVPGIFHLSKAINRKSLTSDKNKTLAKMHARLNHKGLPPLHVDFTPMALWNLDHSILAWFNSSGKQFDFDYLIFYESDIFTTKPLEVIYEKYMKLYDACFVNYEVAPRSWHFYSYPHGCRQATTRWLKQRMLPTTLYRSMFAGALISRRCLERFRKLGIDFSGAPYCQNEMRLPTILTAIGFRVGKLDFPFVRYRPEWHSNEIFANEYAGIFHPIKRLVSEETKRTPC